MDCISQLPIEEASLRKSNINTRTLYKKLSVRQPTQQKNEVPKFVTLQCLTENCHGGTYTDVFHTFRVQCCDSKHRRRIKMEEWIPSFQKDQHSK